jgi:1-acyl-sn-glycerol-3-phosphate acyltransferase
MIPIVPIAIYGSSGLLDSNKKYRNRRREIWFKILKPLGIFEFSHNSSVWISENLRERIAIAYHRMHENDVNHKEVFAI